MFEVEILLPRAKKESLSSKCKIWCGKYIGIKNSDPDRINDSPSRNTESTGLKSIYLRI